MDFLKEAASHFNTLKMLNEADESYASKVSQAISIAEHLAEYIEKKLAPAPDKYIGRDLDKLRVDLTNTIVTLQDMLASVKN